MVRQAHHPEPVEGQYPNPNFQKIPPTPLYKRGNTSLEFESLYFEIYLKFGACYLGFNCPFFKVA